MRVAIAGAGIAGLTSAIALARHGIEVALFERWPELQEIGAGIQLSPNATGLLDRLGILPELDGKLAEPMAIEIGSAASGRNLASIPLGKTARQRYGAPYFVIHRGDLQAGLLATARACPGIKLHLNAEVHDVRATDAGVVFSAGGSARLTDLLIGADGVHSRLRTGFFGHAGPQLTGHRAWRATVRADQVPNGVRKDVTALWMGRGAHVVHYPVAGGADLNVVLVASDAPEAKRPPQAALGPHLRTFLAAVSEWSSWPVLRVDARPVWTAGRVALIGDAAHAMLPTAAQSGAQSIEDAWVLARCLAENPADPVLSLKKYETQRRPRLTRVIREAERNLWIYHPGGPLALARDLAVSALPAEFRLARLDQLFSFTAQQIA